MSKEDPVLKIVLVTIGPNDEALYFKATSEQEKYILSTHLVDSIDFKDLAQSISFAKEIMRRKGFICFSVLVVDGVIRASLHPIKMAFCDTTQRCKPDDHAHNPFSMKLLNDSIKDIKGKATA
jgi:hypothetical protein